MTNNHQRLKNMAHSKKYLNLGCGNTYDSDWINIDFSNDSKEVIKHNLLKGIPSPDNFFEIVYHSHFLEHFNIEQAFCLTKEVYRVLKTGGIHRIVVPNLEYIASSYLHYLDLCLNGHDEFEKYSWILVELFDQVARNKPGGEMGKYFSSEYLPLHAFIKERIGDFNFTSMATKKQNKIGNYINKILEMFISNNFKIGKFRKSGEIHYYMYDRYSLSRLLKNCGFINIKLMNYNTSSIANWSKYKLDYKNNGFINLIIEAQK